MKIHNITYHDRYFEWRYENLHFSSFNLLVGVSGVGKTQILNSIINLKNISQGDSLNGLEWDVIFTSDNHLYRWSGEFERKTHEPFIFDVENSSKKKYKLNREILYKNHHPIIERDENRIIFKGKELPKLSQFESTVSILGEEEDIFPVKKGFNQISYSSKLNHIQLPSLNDVFEFVLDKDSLISKYSSLIDIQESTLSISLKLALVYELNLEVFQEIKNSFIGIFGQVEDIKLEADEHKDSRLKVIAEFPIIKIKEKGVNHWISQDRISSGMLLTGRQTRLKTRQYKECDDLW